MKKTNYLIIGSGIAGLSLAIRLAERFPDRAITLLTKSDENTSNTQFAQGGIAVVTDAQVDSFEKHIQDTLICGGGICNEEVVQMVITEGPKRLQEIIDWGARFDLDKNGNLDLGKEGGHSENRVVHHKDQTGHEMANAMLRYIQKIESIQLINFHFVLDLLVANNTCYGATILNEKTNQISSLFADYTILATGGIGQVYGHTTNSSIATGDGIAMASLSNVEIADMEFIQFHPTALYSTGLNTTFLISEAVRGFGAYLRNGNGIRFMLQYDNRLELAPRDIVSQSIYQELKQGNEPCVYLDCTHLDRNKFIAHFPMIYEQCKQIGINIETDWIPVAPSQHYLCGGIVVSRNGLSSMVNLFVCGESAQTGLHGANRLASNSLLEALVYSNCIFHSLEEKTTASSINNSFPEKVYPSILSLEKVPSLDKFYHVLHETMMQYVGIIRTDIELRKAKEQLLEIQGQVNNYLQKYYPSRKLYELRNMLIVGLLIIDGSLKRKNSIGTFVKKQD